MIYSWLHKRDVGYFGTRVVTPNGEHGRIVWSSQRQPTQAADNTPVEVFHVRLDSGREEDHEVVHYETARPRSVVPDVRIDARYHAPDAVWEQVNLQYYRLLDLKEKTSRRARKEQHEAFSTLRVWFPTWRTWRRANPGAEVPGYDLALETRIEELVNGLQTER